MDTWLSLYMEVLEAEDCLERPALAEVHDLPLKLRAWFTPDPEWRTELRSSRASSGATHPQPPSVSGCAGTTRAPIPVPRRAAGG